MASLGGRAAALLISVATAIGIVALVLPLFLNPIWVSFEQGRAQASAWTGFPEPVLRRVTDAILADLVLGPPAFDVEVDGVPVLNERERAHMRDVRVVFAGFFAGAALLVAGALVVAARRRGADRLATWQSVRDGAAGLVVGLIGAGIVALVAFDVLFELFHRLFFAGGSYSFDPSTERLVQLFPFAFWQETAIVVGVAAVIAAVIVATFAHRRLTAGAPAIDIEAGRTQTPGAEAAR